MAHVVELALTIAQRLFGALHVLGASFEGFLTLLCAALGAADLAALPAQVFIDLLAVGEGFFLTLQLDLAAFRLRFTDQRFALAFGTLYEFIREYANGEVADHCTKYERARTGERTNSSGIHDVLRIAARARWNVRNVRRRQGVNN